MRLLVLGGTNFVGRAVVEQALLRGDDVTTVNRGMSGPPVEGAATLRVDRRDRRALRDALGGGTWDAAIDTWSGAPDVVRQSARLLRERVGHYGYVSSRSVYRWPLPPGADESAPVVDGDPSSVEDHDYAAAKRGAELAVLESFPDRALMARAGLILGPHEDVGRLPWWLERMSQGGLVPAPGPPDLELQYIDARDLAAWMLDAAARRLPGVFNTVSRPGHATMGQLLEACDDVVGAGAELVWLTPDAVEAAGVTGWIDLPIWVPPGGEMAGLHDGDVSAAHAEGLTCRPVHETVADTWQWLQSEGIPEPRSDRPSPGVTREVEHALRAAAHTARTVSKGHRAGHDHRFECVRRVPIFEGLSEDDQHRIAETAVTRHLQPHEQVYGAGDRTGLHIVHRGQVKAYRLNEGGSEQLVRLLFPGDFLGESALLADTAIDHFAVATRPSEVCSVPRAGMRRLLVDRPSVALQMLQTVSERLGVAEEMLAALTGRSVAERLAQQLLHLTDEAGSTRFRLPTSKRDLASYLGTTPETLSRRLGSLQKANVIRMGPHRTVEILDRDRLQQLATRSGPLDRGPR